MKASPIIVNWHAENAPIYSADFQPHGKGRLATGGGDNNVRVCSRLEGWSGIMLMVTVMETGFGWRGSEGRVPLHNGQAYSDCERGQMGS